VNILPAGSAAEMYRLLLRTELAFSLYSIERNRDTQHTKVVNNSSHTSHFDTTTASVTSSNRTKFVLRGRHCTHYSILHG